MSAGQMDLFSVLEEAKLAASAPCLYRSEARGIPAREAEFAAWQQEHGSFGSLLRAHAWTPGFGAWSTSPTERCQAATLSVDLRPDPHRTWDLACDCTDVIGEYLHRGACRHCDWEGPERTGENPAAEDALDHAWPGWRDLPAVPKPPEWHGDGNKKRGEARARWLEHVRSVYPAGWLEDGGPIRTARLPLGTRHVPGATPFGGYDLAMPEVPS